MTRCRKHSEIIEDFQCKLSKSASRPMVLCEIVFPLETFQCQQWIFPKENATRTRLEQAGARQRPIFVSLKRIPVLDNFSQSVGPEATG